MFGVLLLFVLNLVLNIMFPLWMLTVAIIGSIPWQIKVMFSLFLLNGKNKLNNNLIPQLKWFNLIGQFCCLSLKFHVIKCRFISGIIYWPMDSIVYSCWASIFSYTPSQASAHSPISPNATLGPPGAAQLASYPITILDQDHASS